MPRRNIWIIVSTAAMSLICYQRIEHDPHGRYLAQALELVEKRALKEIPRQDLFDGAMRGMVEVINKRIDDNSLFISAKDRANFEAELQQEFGGVGVMIRMTGAEEGEDAKKELIVVNPPLPGTPAEKVGIRAGDRIVEIEGRPTAEMELRDVVRRMRGPVGSEVRLSVLHLGEEEPVHVTVRRDVIEVPSVLGDVPAADGSWDFRLEQDPRIGYLRVTSFGEKTVREMRDALQTLAEQDAQALVLDLRGDSGGRLDAAVEVCKMFLPAGKEIVSIKARDDKEVFETAGDGPYHDIPLAVLVNAGSASASEIVAACLKDHNRAIIVGTRTYGKGTVQHLMNIEGGKSILKLTVATYFRPNRRNIHRYPDDDEDDPWGVQPSEGYEVELTDEQLRRLYDDRQRRDRIGKENRQPDEGEVQASEGPADPQLQRAVEALQRRIGGDME